MTTSITVPVTSPYDFVLSAGILSRFPLQTVDYYEAGVYRRAFRYEETLYLLQAEPAGTDTAPTLQVTCLSPQDTSIPTPLLDKIGWILGANVDLKPLYALMEQNEITRAIKAELYGLKPLHAPSIFEALVIAISEQSISLVAALAIRDRLVKQYGEAIEYAGHTYYTFPTPDAVAASDPDTLRAIGFTRVKAEALLTIARRIKSGGLDVEALFRQPDSEVMATMTAFKGIGPWTVLYALERGAGRQDVILWGDLSLKLGFAKWFGADFGSDRAQIAAFLDPFGAYKGYAAYYFMLSYGFEKYRVRVV